MAVIKPFSAVRPTQNLAAEIAALPYDVYNEEEAREEVKKHPDSFLRIDRAETQLEPGVDPYSEDVYRKAHSTYVEMKRNCEYIKDENLMYYIYSLTMNGRVQTGIVATAFVDDYVNGVIKKHENTRVEKEIDRINHITALGAQTGPIFLAYRSNVNINAIVNKVMNTTKPLYDFVADDGIGHKIYKITATEDILNLVDEFAGINDIYIADGHHRAASAVKVCLKKREENGEDNSAESNYFLSVLFPDDQLMIMDYNRTVKDLNGLSVDELIEKISDKFDIKEAHDGQKSPSKKGEFGMYVDHKWYMLSIKPEYVQKDDPVKALDVSILQDYLLEPILGIKDPRTDERIDFVGGIRGMEELEKRADNDMKISFSMYPTSIHELFNVADAGMLMPPKSTWFEPKLRSGLLIHEF